jgi:hypothetical protein
MEGTKEKKIIISITDNEKEYNIKNMIKNISELEALGALRYCEKNLWLSMKQREAKEVQNANR